MRPSEYIIKKLMGELKGYEPNQSLMEIEDTDEEKEPIQENLNKLKKKPKYCPFSK